MKPPETKMSLLSQLPWSLPCPMQLTQSSVPPGRWGWGGLEMNPDSPCCDNSVFTSGPESQAAVPSRGTHLPHNMNRAGEVTVLCQEKPVDLGICKSDVQRRIRTSLYISSLFHLGKKRVYRRLDGEKSHRLYFDFITRLLEITDRLKKIICFGAAGNFRWKSN